MNPEMKEEGRMPYRNHPIRSTGNTYFHGESKPDVDPFLHEIPLPNKVEEKAEVNSPPITPTDSLSRIFNFLETKITMEEIIILGVIGIILLDGIKDEFILLLLVYILIF